MNKQELEHKLEQARKDRLAADLTFENEIISLEKQLAEAEKPKPRHLDYGLTKSGKPCAIVQSQNGCGKMGPLRNVSESYVYECELTTDVWDIDTNLGNLADDLQALKPLEEFEMGGNSVRINSYAEIEIKDVADGAYVVVSKKDFHAFILNLRCIEYKLKREQGGKE